MKVYKGSFYHPEFPENKVAGVLTIYEDYKIGLELLGSLDDYFDSERSISSTIYGDLYNGKKATLLSCSSYFNIVFNVAQIQEFRAKKLLIGAHVLSEEQSFFNEITIEIDQLAEWIGITGSKLAIEEGFKNLSFSFSQPENIEFKISEDLNGAFLFRQKYPFHSRNFSIDENVFFSISSEGTKSLKTMISLIRDFRKLFSFFVGTKAKINRIVLVSPQEKVGLINPRTDKIYYEEIHLYLNDQDAFLDKRRIDDYPVKYIDIATNFPQILSSWYSTKQKDLLPISNILLDCLLEKAFFEDIHFLTAFQGVEAFHRRFLQDTKALKITHKAYMKSLLEFIDDPELTVKLKNQLTFAYELTAKQRLAEILPCVKSVIPYITNEHMKIWIREIVDSRNYLTHLDPAGFKKLVHAKKLQHYTNLLKATLTILIMSRLGVEVGSLKGIEMKYRESFLYLKRK